MTLARHRGASRPTRVACLIAACAALSALTACLRPAEERARADEAIGQSSQHGLSISVDGGLATVQAHTPDALTLWAQAPTLSALLLRQTPEEAPLRLTLRNVLPDASPTLTTASGLTLTLTDLDRPIPTELTFSVTLPPLDPATLTLSPPDLDDTSPWRFAVLSDVQSGIDVVDDVYKRMNEDPLIRFVISSGDLVNQGTTEQLLDFQAHLRTLNVPFYSTMGNHELFSADDDAWPQLFGRANVHFTFRGVAFSLVDSANASLDPLVYAWLAAWLDTARDLPHVFITHYAIFDPVGPRNASFKSRREAAKLARMLADGHVDAAFFGHIHSFYQFATADIPSYISGGGGAIPERLDGVNRHYLIVDVEPSLNRVASVGLVRVD